MLVAPMHRVGARSERFPATPSIRSIARTLAIHHVRCNGQDRLSVNSVPVGGILSQFAHEGADCPGSKLVNPIVVIAENWKIAFNLVVDHEARLIANRPNSCILYR